MEAGETSFHPIPERKKAIGPWINSQTMVTLNEVVCTHRARHTPLCKCPLPFFTFSNPGKEPRGRRRVSPGSGGHLDSVLRTSKSRPRTDQPPLGHDTNFARAPASRPWCSRVLVGCQRMTIRRLYPYLVPRACSTIPGRVDTPWRFPCEFSVWRAFLME